MTKIYCFNLRSYCSDPKKVKQAHYTDPSDFQINSILIPLHLEEAFIVPPFLQ